MVLCVVVLAAYMCLNTSGLSYRIEPCWYLDQRKLFGQGSFNMLPPVVTDLDGDGSKEVVLITKDLQLKIINAEAPNGDHSEIYIPEEQYSARLSQLNLQKGKIPVALQTGYVSPYDADKERSQVVVVVREDWSVTCYDAQLNVLWEKAVAHKTHAMDAMADKFRIDEVAVMIVPISLKEGSAGVVIVGASMALRESDRDRGIEVEHEAGPSGDEEHPEMRARASLEHFSIYALDAATGHVLWLHDGLEMRPEDFVKSLPVTALKLDRRDLQPRIHHAPGITDWTIFRQSLLLQLPHHWANPSDAALKMAHFERRHVGARKAFPAPGASVVAGVGAAVKAFFPSSSSSSSSLSGKAAVAGLSRRVGGLLASHGRFTGIETPPLAATAVLPHDASEHTEHPNVLVAHTRNGLEVVALRTGVPMTSLALAKGRAYADVDGDGVVDTIVALESASDVHAQGYGSAFAHASHTGTVQHCSIMVLSGLPAQSQLFNGSLCASRHSLQDPINKHSAARMLPERVAVAPPAVLRSLDPRTMAEAKVRDVVVAINTGIVTSFSGSGTFKWQLRGGPTWSLPEEAGADDDDARSSSRQQQEKGHAKTSLASLTPFDADALRVDETGSHDTVYANLLLVGSRRLALVSRDGAFLATADMPAVPVASAVAGDFDSDGVTDVIIVTEDSVLGYRVEVSVSSRGLLLALGLLSSVALVVFVANIRVETAPVSGLTSAPGNAVAKSKSVLTLLRSTEEHHLD